MTTHTMYGVVKANELNLSYSFFLVLVNCSMSHYNDHPKILPKTLFQVHPIADEDHVQVDNPKCDRILENHPYGHA